MVGIIALMDRKTISNLRFQKNASIDLTRYYPEI